MWRHFLLASFALQGLAVNNEACLKARIVSIGSADRWASGWVGFYLSERPISFFPGDGVNVVALHPLTQKVILAESYGRGKAVKLKKDLLGLASETVVLVGLQGPSSQEHLESLRVIQAKLFPVVSSDEGYALIARKGFPPAAEDLGAWADVEAHVSCVVTPALEAQQRARTAAEAAGGSPQEVGAAAGGAPAVAAAVVARAAAEMEAPQHVATKAWLAAGASKADASQAAVEAADAVAFSAAMRGDCPSEVGRQTMRAMRAIPGQEEDASHAIRAAQSAVTEVLLLSGEAEATIRQAKIDAEDGVMDGAGGDFEEQIEEWLHPAVKIDFHRSAARAAQALAQLHALRRSQTSAFSPIFSQAIAARRTAALAAAESAIGGTPGEIVAKTMEALLQLGVHTSAAIELSATYAARATIFEAQRHWKSAPEMGADAEAAAAKAGLRGAAWEKFKASLLPVVADWAADYGLKPEEVGRSILDAHEAMNASQALSTHSRRRPRREAAETAAEVVAQRAASRPNATAEEVAREARAAVQGCGLEGPGAGRIAGTAAARAMAHRMARLRQAGWQEVAASATAAARAAQMAPEEVVRVAARAAAEEVGKVAARRGTGEEVGLAVAAATQAAGVSPELIPVIAGEAIGKVLSTCDKLVKPSLQDVVSAARAASAPSAVSWAAPRMASCAAAHAARLQRPPREAAKDVISALEGVGLAHRELLTLAGTALTEKLLTRAVASGSSGAPMDLGREVLEALRSIGFEKDRAALQAARAAAACAVKVSVARDEPAPLVGDFALKVAEACGAQAEDVQEIAATAVIEGMSSSWSRADTALVGDVKAAVSATGMSKEKAAPLIATMGGQEVAARCLENGYAPAACGAAVHVTIAASGLKGDAMVELGQALMARAAAEHAASNGASPQEVRHAAAEAQVSWAKGRSKDAAARVAAARSVAQRAVHFEAVPSAVGQQAAEATGPGHQELAAVAAAEAMAKLVDGSSSGAGLVQEAARGAGDGTEIRLAQSPEWGLSEQNGKVVIQKVGLRRWILTDDGLLILENRPEFALSVAGPIDAGAQLGLQFHYFTPDHKNSWQMDPSGRISLRHTPSFSLAVYNGALHGGAEVVLWNDPLSMPHNTWTRQAPTSGSLSSTDACKLRVLGSRCGRDSGSWFSGPKDYQKGYVAVSQSPDRDAATESSWAKVVDHSHSSEIAHFIKEPKMGSAFLLKLMDPTGKTVQGYLSCEEVGKDDKRIPDGVFAYVVKDPAGASMFEEEMSSEGLVLSHVGGGGHLCCGKFNEKDYVTGCTWLYVLKGQPEWAAAFAPQSTYVPAAGKKESCWKSFWKLYCLKWIPQWYRRWILLGCFLLGLFVIFWTIVWFVRLFQAPPEPLQINVPYDCDHQPEHMWSHTKKAWCCEHWDQGCPTTTVKPTPAAPKFPMAPGAAPTAPGVGGPPGGPVVSRAQSSDEDCFTDVLNWQRDWTISKQNFCCEKHGIACRAALTTAAFDCDEDYHKWTELWSYRKKLYCCLHHERGCPAKGEAEMGSSESFDCAAGYGDWEAWEQKKKEWCCYHASVACPGTPSQKYDCAQNYENWMHDWSEGKKVWCCFHNGRGCRDSNSQGYDCDAGVQNWQVGWSNSKMDYCCQTRGIGCSAASEG